MKKRVFLGVLSLILVSIIIANISAEFSVGNKTYELMKFAYAPGENLDGWINLSISDEPGSTLVRDSLGNGISLLNFLKSSGETFSCSIENCNPDYLISKRETTKDLFIEKGDSALVGIVLENSPIGEIKFINFTISSDAPIGCQNQLEVDFLNDEEVDMINNNPGMGICSQTKNYGCFDSNASTIEAKIPTNGGAYCQKVNLIKSPGFNLGAEVKQESGNNEIIMTLYNEMWEEIGGCNLTGVSGIFEEKSCKIDYPVIKDSEGYLCISGLGNGTRKIKAVAKENCGKEYFPEYINDLSFAYKMFIVGSTFASSPTIKVKNSLEEGNSLGSLTPAYLDLTYPNYPTCPSEGCIIPIKINSNVDQTVTLKDLTLEYVVPGIDTLQVHQFVNLEEVPPLVSIDGSKRFQLKEANFSISGDYGKLDYWLKINNQTILKENLTIDRVPEIKNVYPQTTYSAYPTEFKLQIESNSSISSISWDFGDGTNATGTESKKTHIYANTGTYSLTATVIDAVGRMSYKTFTITVGSPEEIINSTIQKYFQNSQEIKTFVNSIPVFEKSEISRILDLEANEEKVKSLQRDYLIATTTSEYNEIMTKLLNIFIPEQVYVSLTTQPLDYLPSAEKINLETLKAVAGGNYDNAREEDYKNAILYWNQKNLATSVTIKSYSVKDALKGGIHLVSFVEITPKKIGGSLNTPYLIIQNLKDMHLKENYYETNASGDTSINLDTLSTNSVKFSTSEEVGIASLPIFISPGLDNLELGTKPKEAKNKPLSWTMILLGIIITLLIGIGIYFGLNKWYRNKYEKYLFKNRNNLYNLLVYFENSKKKGISEDQIKTDLKKAGWTSEQIDYVIKKYANKSTELNWFSRLFSKNKPSLNLNNNFKNPRMNVQKIQPTRIPNKAGLIKGTFLRRKPFKK